MPVSTQAMVKEHNVYHSNGNTHLHSVSTGNRFTSEATLVQIDIEPIANGLVLTSNNTATIMGQPTTDNQRNIFRKLPIRSILKNAKVHNSSNELELLNQSINGQPKNGILKKKQSPISQATVAITDLKQILDPEPSGVDSAINNIMCSTVVSDTKVASQICAKSAPSSSVQFRIDSASSSASNAKSVSIQIIVCLD